MKSATKQEAQKVVKELNRMIKGNISGYGEYSSITSAPYVSTKEERQAFDFGYRPNVNEVHWFGLIPWAIEFAARWNRRYWNQGEGALYVEAYNNNVLLVFKRD